MAYYYDTARRSPSSSQYAPSLFSTRYTAPRPSTSSDYEPSVIPSRSDKRKSRSRHDSDHPSIMSSYMQTRKERPPTPPLKDIPSFTPAMNAEEDTRSEIRAIQSRLRGVMKRIVNVFRPTRLRSSPPSGTDTSFDHFYHHSDRY